MKTLFEHLISSCTIQDYYHSQVEHVFVDDCAYEMEPCWFASFLVLIGAKYGENSFLNKECSRSPQTHSSDEIE